MNKQEYTPTETDFQFVSRKEQAQTDPFPASVSNRRAALRAFCSKKA